MPLLLSLCMTPRSLSMNSSNIEDKVSMLDSFFGMRLPLSPLWTGVLVSMAARWTEAASMSPV